ncbi:unnamed protein product [Polarella glacialis]|uniref:SET domain-containing protein n=1 Tax=Polarella glacialis TaxID=89957 RepID=A0A813JFX1_POLGL|nr:unnamed protein product [Polarella glacialis]CAE8679073.1 unnamed protein product [Polarella glacialis]
MQRRSEVQASGVEREVGGGGAGVEERASSSLEEGAPESDRGLSDLSGLSSCGDSSSSSFFFSRLQLGAVPGKGRALLSAEAAEAGSLLLLEEPLLCAALPDSPEVCATCLGDAVESCQACGDGCCQDCLPHCCPQPDKAELDIRASIWFRLYERYVLLLMESAPAPDQSLPLASSCGQQELEGEVDWSAFARVPTSVYEGWGKFADAAELFVQPVRRRLRQLGKILPDETEEGSLAQQRVLQALTTAGFLDFYRLARANATQVGDRGSAIFSTHACLNHACDANAVAFRVLDVFPATCGGEGGAGTGTSGLKNRHPASLLVLAQRQLAEGEEVSIDYLGGQQEGSSLQSTASSSSEQLFLRYGFCCRCPPCLERGGGSATPLPVMPRDENKLFSERTRTLPAVR